MFVKMNTIALYLLSMFLVFALTACGTGATPSALPPTSTPLPTPAAANSDQAAPAPLRTFVIVPEESQASYMVDEQFFEGALAKLGIKAGNADVVGSTQNIEGQLQINLADLSAPLGTNRFTVNLTTLTTDQSRRDNWIRENGPQFNNYPVAEFVATGVSESPATYTAGDEVQFKMNGDLTIREVTRPVTFDVTAKLDGDTATGVATAQLRMTDFGIEPPNFANTLTVADEFMVQVEFTARERP